MTPATLTAIGAVAAAVLSGLATFATTRATSRKTGAERDHVITSAAEKVVTMMQTQMSRLADEIGAVRAELEAERHRCNALQRKVDELLRGLQP